MLPVLEFFDTDSLLAYLGRNEISQKNNPNANARLFIVRNHRSVAKIFDGFKCKEGDGLGISFLPGAKKNIENVMKISEMLSIDQFPQLALPTSFISFCGQLVGYEMPYISRLELSAALADPRYSLSHKISWFNQLVDVILSLPDEIFIGDLHPQNVIVRDNGTIALIDVDGFSLASRHLLTCPATYMEGLPQKYFDSSGNLRISRDTDILCLFRIFFLYLFDGCDIAVFPRAWSLRLPEYLEKRGVDPVFASAVSKLFSPEHNTLHSGMFSCWNTVIPQEEYQKFLELTGLYVEERSQEIYLNALINEMRHEETS